ncbi:hypothetical protein BKA70DRAFT_1306816 [Coprinopsis sp. MPI-PUGE-AT-0042]|nr:hypothetical protein BKA70DRAFT_1356971 [Coprinopsis sp. MPI-PUGE-AT-0042]KAH6902402.1 hypothetical protein BKA70DRAFT_1306816 [Coprinopsis sp. MPI-PUGE-AT-0042]
MEGGLKDVREFAENVDGESAARLDAVEGRLREDQSLGSRVGAMESRVLALESATPTNTLAVLRDHERSVDVKIEALRVEIGKLDLNIQKNALTNTVSTAAHPATSTNDQSIVYPADKRLRTGFDMQPTTSTIQPFPIQPSTFGGNHTAPRASNLGRGGGRFGKQNSGPNSRIRVGPGYWTGQGSNAMDIARKLVSETVLAQGSFFRPHNLVNAYFEDPGQTVLVIDISGATGAEMLLNSWPARFPPWVAQWGTTRAERVQQGNGMGQGMM